jgi:shikimate kinase
VLLINEVTKNSGTISPVRCIFVPMKEETEEHNNELPDRIYLIGFMGSGKTTAGKRLAKMLGYRFVDLDKMIEHHYKSSIPLLFEQYDEAAFRLLEKEMLQKTSAFSATIIATGGGTPVFYDNMAFLKQSGLTIYLQLPAAALAERLLHARRKRPLLQTVTREELVPYIESKLQEREDYYQQADLIMRGVSLKIGEMARAVCDYSRR